MEIMLLAESGLTAAAMVLILLGQGEGGVVPAASRVFRRVVRWARGALRRLGKSRVVAALLETRHARRLVEMALRREGVSELGLGAPEVAAALVLGFAAVCVVSGVLMGSAAASVVAGVALVGLVVARDAQERRRARRETVAEMPGIYRTLSVAMGSGQTLAQAVEYVGAHERGPAARVFSRMSLRLRCGMGAEEAVGKLSEELEVPGCDLLATALVISHRTGSPLRDLLQRSARLVERQGEFERLLAVKTAQVRLSVRIVCALPAAMIGLLALISPDFQEGLLTATGLACVLLAMLLDALALLIIRRLVAGVL